MKVEVLAPPEESFVVGRDLVGHSKIGSDPDVWEDLIDDAGAFTAQRGGTTSRLNALEVGLLSVPVKNADPETDFRLRVGRRIRLFDEARSKTLWFGRISDIPAFDEADYLVTTLAGADAVDELTQSTQKGAGTPGETQTLRQRVEELAKTATIPLVYVQDTASIPDLTTAGGSEQTATQVGHRYRVEITFTWEGPAAPGDMVGWLTAKSGGADVETTLSAYDLGGTAPRVVLEFVAQASSASFRVLGRKPGVWSYVIHASDVTVTRVEGPAVLQAVGQESSCTDHLDMACDSVGAIWRPTLAGTVEVIEGNLTGGVVARFSDDPDDLSRDASYTKVEMGYAATDDLINDLTVTNHGPSADTARVYTNAASIAAYGRRATTIDTCLATSELMDARAAEVMDAADEPRWAPRSLTYAYDDLPDVPDLYDLVTVTRRGVVHTCQVVGVPHDVQPDPNRPDGLKHFVTLTLRKVA